MYPNIIFARLRVILTFEVVTALLGFILIKIELHGHPFFLGSHAKKGIGYHVRVLSSIAPPYTTNIGDYGETRHISPDEAAQAIVTATAFLRAIKILLSPGRDQ
jgi:hypothetical protein